jgi:phage terminase large subunit-like protein
MVEFPQSVPNLTEASTNLYELIKGRGLAVYPDADMRLSISRAVGLETSRGWRIAKEKVAHKIDVVVALAQAALGAVRNQQSEPGMLTWIRGEVLRQQDPAHRPEEHNEMIDTYNSEMKRILDLKDAARGVRHIETLSSGSTPAGSVAPSMAALAFDILRRR